MKRLWLLVALVAVVAYAGWRMGYINPPFLKTAEQREAGAASGAGSGRGGFDGPVVITAFDLRRADVPVMLDAIGTAQALNTVTVRSQVDGKLIEVNFKEGQDVKAGDVLARIDPTTYQATYDQAVAKKAQDEAQLANAKIDLDRYVRLAQGNFGPKQQADTQRALVAQLDAQVKQDQANIDNAKAILDYTTIRSPLDGRTGIRIVDPGNLVQASSTSGIVVITQIKPIAVVFTLAQQNLRAVANALARGPLDAQAYDSGMTAMVARGQVTVVDNQVDPATGTVKIKAVFPNADLALWPGQFVNIKLTTEILKDVIVAPTASVQRGPNGAFVYVVKDDGAVAQTNVVVGQQNERLAVIQSGLEPPAKVATSGFARLRDGAKARVIATPPQGASAEARSETPAPAASDAAPAAAPRGDGQRGGRRRGQGGGQ
ncbi:MAG TPA: efflux RND transporter periplasmic adaptor subunit [Rhodoblastus sp.]|nr:efflux RND transporter periplasmic adaptor subunit [Rhodoblastus sp.]